MSESGDLNEGRTWRFWGRTRHLELLITLVGITVAQSFLSGGSAIQRIIFSAMFFGIVLSAIRTLSNSKVNMVFSITLGIVAFAGACLAERYASTALLTVVYLSYLAVFASLLIALCESVFGAGPPDSDRIVGAIAIFFVLGLVWALIYSLLEIYQPTAFALPVLDRSGIQQDMVSEFIYFSNVTLTTLGYGDIVPVTKPARMLSNLEAMTGQMYIAIVIARLVGLQISERMYERRAD
ncbi:MAG: ion channel [Rubripirellula sp.]